MKTDERKDHELHACSECNRGEMSFPNDYWRYTLRLRRCTWCWRTKSTALQDQANEAIQEYLESMKGTGEP